MTPNGSNDTVTLEIIRASEVTPREVKWLWYPYIPFGKITLLQGDPGDGKSKFMLALSALLTDGKPLPFQEVEEASEPMTVIYQTTEDDADDTVVPRFIASGGNRDNLIFIKENEKHLTFGDDRLRQAIERYNVRLLILDPLSSLHERRQQNEDGAEPPYQNRAGNGLCNRCCGAHEQEQGYLPAVPNQRLNRHCRRRKKYSGGGEDAEQGEPFGAVYGAGEVQSRPDRQRHCL